MKNDKTNNIDKNNETDTNNNLNDFDLIDDYEYDDEYDDENYNDYYEDFDGYDNYQNSENNQNKTKETFINENTNNYGNYNYNSNSFSKETHTEELTKKRKKDNIILIIVIVAVLGLSIGVGFYGTKKIINSNDNTSEIKIEYNSLNNDNDNNINNDTNHKITSKVQLELKDDAAVQTQITKVSKSVMPSIVSVYNNFTQETQDFWGQTYAEQGESAGSGIIISKNGNELLIATNNHVIDNADTIEIQFINGKTAKAELKGTDSINDLAVISVDISNLDNDTLNDIAIASLGNSDNLEIGETVVAIGNSLGYGQSVTVGVISALNRELQTTEGTGTFIQTDAAINPGNSGGALVDLNGNVIGINSNKLGGDIIEGMGYAIPMSKAEPIIENLASESTKYKIDEDKQGRLGIKGVSVNTQVSKAYNIPQGIYVDEIEPNTGASNSELQKGDIIVKLNGAETLNMTALQKQLTYYEVGQEITLTVKRMSSNNEYLDKEIKLVLSEKEENTISQEEFDYYKNDQGFSQMYPDEFYNAPWKNFFYN